MGSILKQKLRHQSLTLKKIDINYLKSITKDFSPNQIIGRGGYGIVYKGEQENGDVVAVKKFTMSMEGIDDEQLMNEVQHVLDICHPNIVRLEGYCYHTETQITLHNGRNKFVDEVYRLLCFEYLPNGSLDKHLSDESSGLDWQARYNIIEGICAGLYCLHEGREGAPIIHLDLKPSNILLDKNMTPKIADFGLSRLIDGGKTHTCTKKIIGTRGYMAPEYIDSYILSKESDIFSLGVIIVEIVTGQRKYPEGTSNEEFTEVYEKWRTRLQKTSTKISFEEECRQVDQCIGVGRKCMDKDRKRRPNIIEIIEILERIKCSKDMLVMGIDLGTTYSCVGVWMHGRVEIVANDQGNRTTPSCVAFTEDKRLVGESAINQLATNTSNTIFDVKRLIGRSFCDASVKSDAKYWPFQMIEGPHNRPRIKVSYLGGEKELSPEEFSAMVLVKMKETAEAYAGRTIREAVITVPAYFNGHQRQATKDAGAIAGLNVMCIINEPTAAAIAYAHNRDWAESTVLVYELGGGTLDVSIAVVKKVEGPTKDKFVSQLQVMATAGDTHLGGEDFTNNMVDHFFKEFNIKNPHISGDIRGDKKALGHLRRSCQAAKKKLSTNPRTAVEVDALFQGVDFHCEITREQFEKLNEDLFRRCMKPIAKCLNDAKMDMAKLDDVVLVGGSTRIPRVHQLVQDFFGGKELCRNINVDEAAACGATIQAAMLMGGKAPQVVDITPFSYGIGMLEGVMCEVIPRNTPIPRTWRMPFVAVKANQSSVEITVYEDERAMENRFPMALEPRTEVAFHVNQNGILHVGFWAQDKEGWIPITNLVGSLTKEEVERMVKDTQKYKDQLDEEHKKNVQARNDIQNLLFTIINNRKNLEDSAARLRLQEESTPEQEKETPGIFRYLVPGKARDKNMKMMRAHNETIKKLPDRIRKLQEIAEEAAKCLENDENTTSMIIQQKKLIEDDYHNICKQIEAASQSKFDKSFPQK